MLINDHIEGNQYNHILDVRLFNSASDPLISDGSNKKGLLYFNNGSDVPKYYNGTVWKTFTAGTLLADIALTTDYLITGVAGVATAVARSAVKLNELGVPTGNVAMNGFKLTGIGTVTSGDADSTAATKGYVDSVAQGLNAKNAVDAATTAALPACTYNSTNGTLTANAVGAIPSQDGVIFDLEGMRLLVKNQASSFQNGIYALTTVGSGVASWVLTRTEDASLYTELNSAYCFVSAGTTYGDTGWVQTSALANLTSSTQSWTQFSGAATFTAGNGLVKVGNVFHFANSTGYGTAIGGIPYASTANAIDILPLTGSLGRILCSASDSPEWSSYSLPSYTSPLTANTLLYASTTTQVSLTNTANNAILTTNGSGVPAFATDIPTAVTHGGQYSYRVAGTDVSMNDGGTGSSLTGSAGGIIYAISTTQMGVAASPATGQFVRWNASGAPTGLDLFGTNNSWAAAQNLTMNGTVGVAFVPSSSPSNGNTVDSGILQFTAKGNDGSAHTSDWYIFSDATSTSALANLEFQFRQDGGAFASRMSLTDVGILTLGGSTLRLTYGAYTASITTPVIGANVVFTLPTASGTVALTTGSTFTTGTWNAGIIQGQYGGTGVNNAGKSITLGGSWTHTGAHTLGLTTTANTLLTLPTTGTLATLAGTETFTNKTLTTPTINAGTVNALTTFSLRDSLAAYNLTIYSASGPALTANRTLTIDVMNGDRSVILKGAFFVNALFLTVIGGVSADQPMTLRAGASGCDVTFPATGTLVNDSVTTLSSLTSVGTVTVGTWNATAISEAKGGTGADLSAAAAGSIFYTNGSNFVPVGSAAVNNKFPVSSGTSGNTVSWSAYTMPATITGNRLLLADSGGTAVTQLAPVNSSILITDGSGVPSWGLTLNPARNVIGSARKYSQWYAGTGAQIYIDVTHNLNTRDVVVSSRKAASTSGTDTGTLTSEFVWSKIEVRDANTVRFYSNRNIQSTDYYVITVIG
jgi:hypothetical protein